MEYKLDPSSPNLVMIDRLYGGGGGGLHLVEGSGTGDPPRCASSAAGKHHNLW